MALQTLNTIKQWFKTGLKPTQAQFWDTWDSFRHKFDKIPVKEVDGLDELLLSKADKTILDNHIADKNAHASQVNTDWNSESGFSQLLNKPEFRTINGETILGTGDIIIEAGGDIPTLQQVLDTDNKANKGIILTSGSNTAQINPNYIFLDNNNATIQLSTALDRNSSNETIESGEIILGSANAATLQRQGDARIRRNPNSKGTTVFKLKETNDEEVYTLATTDDFKTINGESILGEGNLDIEPQGLKSVLDADPTASYGESKATLMGDYGTSKFNEIIVSDETEKTGIYQLKNQLSFDHTVLDSNDIGNITLSEGNVILTRDKSNNQTVVDIADPVANTQLRFPAKSEEGKTYTIATTDDFKTINGESIVGSGDILINGGDGNIPTLQEVLDKDRNATNASINLLSEDGESQTTVHEGGLNISEKTESGFLITDINKLGVSVSKDEETTFVNVLADELSLNKNLSGNPVKQGIVLNEDSSGASKIKLPLTSDGDVKILATTEDFKTINGESIVGEGDITIEGGTTPDATTAVKGIVKLIGDLGGTADNPTTPTAVHKIGNESITGQKSINNSLNNSGRFTFNTFNDATNSTLDATTTSSVIPAMKIAANTGGATGLLVSTFNSGTTGIKIEPTPISPATGTMLVLSNKITNNGAVNISTPLTVLRDNVAVASISDLGDVTGSKFVKTGGLANQFLKADGSIDSNVYANDANLVHKTGNLTESIDGYKTFLTRTVFNDQTQFGSLITFTNASQILPSAIVPSLARYEGGIAFLGTGSSDTKFTLTSNNVHTGIFKYVMPDISGTLALKSDIPTNIITGTGTANYIPKFISVGVLGNSSIQLDNSGNAIIYGGAGADTLNLVKSTGASIALNGATGAIESVKLVADNSLNPDFFAYVGGAERLRIQATTGNIGIGTILPTSIGSGYKTLEIKGENGSGFILGQTGQANSYVYTNENGLRIESVNKPVVIATNNVIRQTINTNGTTVFSGSVTSPTFIGSTGVDGFAGDFTKTGGYGASIVLKNTSSLSNAFIRFLKSDGNPLANINPTATGISVDATITSSFIGNLNGIASSATNWGGQTANLSTSVSSIVNLVAQQPGGSVAVADKNQMKSWLGINERPYKVYSAIISQTGTADPTITVLENTLGTSISMERRGIGHYRTTISSGVFPGYKTFRIIQNGQYSIPKQQVMVAAVNVNTASYDMYTEVDGVKTDSILLGASYEIRIYP